MFFEKSIDIILGHSNVCLLFKETLWYKLLLNPRLSNGIENAKQAHQKFNLPNIAFHQSVTTVYELVELLIENSSFIDD